MRRFVGDRLACYISDVLRKLRLMKTLTANQPSRTALNWTAFGGPTAPHFPPRSLAVALSVLPSCVTKMVRYQGGIDVAPTRYYYALKAFRQTFTLCLEACSQPGVSHRVVGIAKRCIVAARGLLPAVTSNVLPLLHLPGTKQAL
jgi:hypothetical protein